MTTEKLEAAEFVILFTTTPASSMSAERCVEAYRLRWQVELQFKRWKSPCHFDKLPNYRDDTMLAWVTAKLLLGLLLDRVAAAKDGDDATTRPGARQAWKITSLLWPLVLAALLPVGLANAIALVPAMSRRLDSLDDVVGITRQIDVFRWRQEELDGCGWADNAHGLLPPPDELAASRSRTDPSRRHPPRAAGNRHRQQC